MILTVLPDNYVFGIGRESDIDKEAQFQRDQLEISPGVKSAKDSLRLPLAVVVTEDRLHRSRPYTRCQSAPAGRAGPPAVRS